MEPPANSSPPSEPAVELEDLTVERSDRFGENEVCLRAVSLQVDPGESIVLAGEHGSGISELCRLLAGGEARGTKILSGRMRLFGEELSAASRRRRRRRCRLLSAYLGARPRETFEPGHSVRAALREFDRLRARGKRRRDPGALAEVLYGVGVFEPERFLEQKIRELGDLAVARLALARALFGGAKLLICDHTDSSLAPSDAGRWFENLAQVREERGLGMVASQGRLAGGDALASRVAVFFEGGILEEGSREEIRRNPRVAYTRAFVEGAPRVDRPRGPLVEPSREAIAEAEEIIHERRKPGEAVGNGGEKQEPEGDSGEGVEDGEDPESGESGKRE